MRTRHTGTVVSRTVDEHGTTTVIEGGRAALTISYRPHETLSETFQRIVEHVQHSAPRPAGLFLADGWHRDELLICGIKLTVSYGAGMGIKISHQFRSGVTYVRHLPAALVTLEAVGELYGTVLNKAIDLPHAARAAA